MENYSVKSGRRNLKYSKHISVGVAMSRIGKMPIHIPSGVEINIDSPSVSVKGPRGTLAISIPNGINCEISEETLSITRNDDLKPTKALHGLTRALLFNMVTGVDLGFRRSLELIGIGYRVQQNNESITLQVGFSHNVEFDPPEGVKLEVEGTNRIHIDGIDKQAVGEVAAQIKKIRPPNPYTGKGVRYLGEQVRLRPGKTGGRRA